MNAAAPAPVWLLAAPSSGASWVAACLGRHPQICAVPELHLFMAAEVGGLLDIFDIGQGGHSHGLLRALAVLEFGGQTDEGVALARDWLEQRRDMPTAEVALHLAARAAPRRLLVPDSESALRPMDLQRLATQLPSCALIHLVRHPWDQGCLLDAWARSRLFVPQDFKDHGFRPAQVDPQIPWLRCNRNLGELLGRLPPDAARRLRCEDVEHDEVGALSEICAWLGLSIDPADLAPMAEPEGWNFAGYGPATAPHGLEAEVLEPIADKVKELAAATSLDLAPPWQPGDGGFDPAVRELARRYGYR